VSRLATALRPLIPARMRERLLRKVNQLRARLLPEPYRTVLPYTMVDLPRLRALDELIRRVDTEAVVGDVVECGTCNGGSAAVLARVACRSTLGRHTWLLDSFQGMPAATDKDGAAAAEFTGLCRGSQDVVREVLGKVGVPDSAYTLVPGWFQDTLPTLPVDRISVLNVDADWHDSVLQVLDALWDRISPGGYVHLDDYGYWQGCRQAWHEFAARRGITAELVPIDGLGVYLRKAA
jgi:O-methyltransferase